MRGLIIIIFSLSLQIVHSQSIKSTIFGFKGGYNRSIVRGVEQDGSKTGYVGNELYGSFFSDTKLVKKWHFENELLFSWTDNYHFIEIPIHVKFFFAENWNILFGPKLDFLIDDDDFDEYYHFWTFGISTEAGVQYFIFRRFLCELRYSYGFSEHLHDLILDINKGKRNTLRIGIGVQF